MIKTVISVCLFLNVSIFSSFANAEGYLSDNTFMLAAATSLAGSGGVTDPATTVEGRWATSTILNTQNDTRLLFRTQGRTTNNSAYCHQASHCQTCDTNAANHCLTCPWGYQLSRIADQIYGPCIVCQTGCMPVSRPESYNSALIYDTYVHSCSRKTQDANGNDVATYKECLTGADILANPPDP